MVFDEKQSCGISTVSMTYQSQALDQTSILVEVLNFQFIVMQMATGAFMFGILNCTHLLTSHCID